MSDTLHLARDRDWLSTATSLLDHGALVVYPTDTCYALGGDALDEDAVTRVLDAKGRPRDFSLTVCVGSVEEIRHVARLTPLGRALAQRFLPGPLTLVLPALGTTAAGLLGPRDTVGVRIPAHPDARALASHFGPITATRATFNEGATARTVDEARAELGALADLFLDGGPVPGTLSTIVDATGSEPKIIREGAIPASDLVVTHG